MLLKQIFLKKCDFFQLLNTVENSVAQFNWHERKLFLFFLAFLLLLGPGMSVYVCPTLS